MALSLRLLPGFLPILWLLLQAGQEQLGANPIEQVVRFCGDWALWLLLLTLSLSPLRRMTGNTVFLRWRRMIALFSFFYTCLHITAYVVLDRFFDWQDIIQDIRKRPYITIGVFAFLLLLPLAVTSTRAWMRRLGASWQKLHRLVYPAALLVIFHFFLMTRTDWRTPGYHALVLALLLALRLPRLVTHPVVRQFRCKGVT
ncbi:MAG: sulfoxide reductase heme-binding subunit YedZ [Magnetococcales bacterium]|nr:sulfoxide reductase heme-binding subunit YedZ [Magnetococcales bacterium]